MEWQRLSPRCLLNTSMNSSWPTLWWLFSLRVHFCAEQDEQLLSELFAVVARDQRFPWWMVPPRGEQPFNELSKHRPRDPASFLRAYLTGGDRTARMWASACTREGRCRNAERSASASRTRSDGTRRDEKVGYASCEGQRGSCRNDKTLFADGRLARHSEGGRVRDFPKYRAA